MRHQENKLALFLLWLARLGSIASGALLLLFMFGGQESMQFTTLNEIFGFCFFPIGILVGMTIAWRYELLGGSLTALSLAGFYVWHFVTAGQFTAGPYFLLFASPGILFLISSLLGQKSGTDAN